jgi:hypothetical protein
VESADQSNTGYLDGVRVTAVHHKQLYMRSVKRFPAQQLHAFGILSQSMGLW